MVDTDKWELSLDCTDHGNNEAQCYTRREDNAFVDSEGILYIVASEEAFSGPAYTFAGDALLFRHGLDILLYSIKSSGRPSNFNR